MYISRIVVRDFRNFRHLDVALTGGVTSVVGESNSGKSNLVHAIRLAIDGNLSSFHRQLDREDFASGTDWSKPSQILISVEFRDFASKPNEEGMLHGCQVEDNVARITYRFRPRRDIRASIADGEHPGVGLSIADYRWELVGGGEPDPATVDWNKDFGKSIRFDELQQSYLIVTMEPLRDVEQRLRQSKHSPLAKLLTPVEIDDAERSKLITHLVEANEKISSSQTIQTVGASIKSTFDKTAGPAFTMGVKLGMGAPTFGDISKGLKVLLTNHALCDFEPSQNGLGLNNILYICLLLTSFQRRKLDAKTAGQLLIIEEPEAHLHPQLQRVLFSSLEATKAQTIITTHSTHITSQSRLDSVIVLTQDGTPGSHSIVAAGADGLTNPEVADLERYLDATRSTLLFARKVLLVEGPAELFLIPPLAKKVLKVDLESEGISVIPIHGTHFNAFAKLFGPKAIRKRCAILTDGDSQNAIEEAVEELPGSEVDEDQGHTEATTTSRIDQLRELENEFVTAFVGDSTFELELVDWKTLTMFAATCDELGATIVAKRLRSLAESWIDGCPITEQQRQRLESAKQSILRTAKRVGKARFAQVASKHSTLADSLPSYISDAIQWLRNETNERTERGH